LPTLAVGPRSGSGKRLYVLWRNDKLAYNSSTAKAASGPAVNRVGHGRGIPDEEPDFFLSLEAQFLALLE
jgi:hypothetical protein